MTEPRQIGESFSRRAARSAALTAVHLVLWAALLLILLSVVPRCVRRFEDLGVALPSVSEAIIRISVWVAAYWHRVIVGGVVGLTLDFGVLLVLQKKGQLLAGTLLALVPLLLGIFVLLEMWIPMVEL